MWKTKRTTESMRCKNRCDAILYSQCSNKQNQVCSKEWWFRENQFQKYVTRFMFGIASSHGRALSLWQYSIIWLNFMGILMSYVIHIEGKVNPSMPNASLNNTIRQILLLHLEEDSLFPFGDYWLSPSSHFEMIFMILRGDSWCAYYYYYNPICLPSNLFTTQCHTLCSFYKWFQLGAFNEIPKSIYSPAINAGQSNFQFHAG